MDRTIGRIKGHVGEAKANASTDQAQRRAAERAPNSIILGKNDVQGEYDANRVLYTTLGGQARAITAEDLATFRHNVRQVQRSFKKGITARQVIDMAKSRPLKDAVDGTTDLDRARAEIRTAVPASALVIAQKALDVRFITNAGPSSDVSRHHVLVRFLGYDDASRDMLTTTTSGERAKSALTPQQAANKMRHGRLAFDCDCKRHRYFLRYVATIGGFNAGRDEHGYPKIRNPGLRGVACKHVLRAMSEVDSSNTVLRFLTRTMEKVLHSADNRARVQISQEEAEAVVGTQTKRASQIKTSEDRAKANAAARAKRALLAAAKAKTIPKPKRPKPASKKFSRAVQEAAKQFDLPPELVQSLLSAQKKGI